MPTNRPQLYKYKGDKCANCGLSVQEMFDRFKTVARLFEFNHIDPRKKAKDYDNVIRRRVSTEQLDEIDKCALLCRICHGVFHSQDTGAELLVQVKIAGREYQRRYKGQLIFDHIEQHGRFFTDEEVLLRPYRVLVEDQPEQVLFGHELKDGKIVELLEILVPDQKLQILGWNHRQELLVECLPGGELHFVQSVSFPILQGDFREDKGRPTLLWVRRGMALGRDGEVLTGGTIDYTTKPFKRTTDRR